MGIGLDPYSLLQRQMAEEEELRRQQMMEEAARASTLPIVRVADPAARFEAELARTNQNARNIGSQLGGIARQIGGTPQEDEGLEPPDFDFPDDEISLLREENTDLDQSEPEQDTSFDFPQEEQDRFSGDQEVIQAPRIEGLQDPRTNDIAGMFQDWMERQPNRDDYKPSVGRRIVGGIAAVLASLGTKNPLVGKQLADEFVNRKYNRAKEDWTEEGQALGTFGKYVQDISESERQREKSILGYEGTKGRIEAALESVDQRREAENQQHQDRLARLTEDSERRKEIARHNRTVEGFTKEELAIKRSTAESRRTSADAYASRVQNLNERGQRQQQEKKLNPFQYQRGLMDVIQEMFIEQPQMERYFKRGKDKRDIFLKPRQKLNPEEAQVLRMFLAQAKERMSRYIPGGTDVEPYEPLRPDVP